MTLKMELTFDIQKMLSFMMMIIVIPLPGVSGQILVDTNVTSCDGTGANINFSVDLQTGSILAGSETWYYEAIVIANKPGGLFTPAVNYTSRLHSYSIYGLTLDNVTNADEGRYSFEFSYLSSPPPVFKTVTTTLIVKVTPSESCVPSYRQDGASAICELDNTANCGSPRLVPIWTNTSGNNFTVINPGNYTCCATGSILTDCYRGSSSFCRTFNVTVPTPTTPEPTSSSSSTTVTTSASSSSSTTVTTSGTSATTTTTGTSSSDIKVIVPAVVVPCGLLIIGAIILVGFCQRRRAGKNVHKSPDDIVTQNKDNKKDKRKQSIGHGKVTNNLHGEYITPDGFIIYPGPAARSTARSYKDMISHGGTDQYSRPDSWTYHHQAGYTPNTYTSAYTRKGKHPVTDQYSRPDSWTYHYQAGYTPNTYTSAYTHKGKHHVTDQYSGPYSEVYGYQTAYLPSTHKSARTYEQRANNYDIEGHQQASHPMATSRLAYGQTMYYPQTGYYGQSSHDAYYRGDGQYSYGQMSRSHHDYNGLKQQRDYYSQYEMTDYRHDKIGDMHTKQDTSFYY